MTEKHFTHPVVQWLMTDARRQVDPSKFLETFADQLREAGVDVSRIATGVPILHPHIHLAASGSLKRASPSVDTAPIPMFRRRFRKPDW